MADAYLKRSMARVAKQLCAGLAATKLAVVDARFAAHCCFEFQGSFGSGITRPSSLLAEMCCKVESVHGSRISN